MALGVEDGDRCQPGDDCVVRIEIGFPEQLPPGVEVGSRFVLRDGPRVVARGTILDIVATA